LIPTQGRHQIAFEDELLSHAVCQEGGLQEKETQREGEKEGKKEQRERETDRETTRGIRKTRNTRHTNKAREPPCDGLRTSCVSGLKPNQGGE
jgi:hypothetical protein